MLLIESDGLEPELYSIPGYWIHNVDNDTSSKVIQTQQFLLLKQTCFI